MLIPPAETIERIRGNTYPEEWTVKLAGVVEDITGRTYVLSVYKFQVLQWAHASVGPYNAAAGIVRVPLTEDEADLEPGSYYWRLDQTSAEGTLTVGAGEWIVRNAPPI